MSKIKSLKIKQNDGSYSNPYDIGADASNVDWDANYTLEDVIGNADVQTKGSLQSQIDSLGTNDVGRKTANIGEIFNDYDSNAANRYAHAEGSTTSAFGGSSHTEGKSSVTTAEYAHAEGYQTTASAQSAHAEGYGTSASGQNAHTEGYGSSASGQNAHAEGYYNTVSADNAHAEGYRNLASNNHTHAEGYCNTVSGLASHAEGYLSSSNGGTAAHTEGYETYTADGQGTHAEGSGTTAIGTGAHAEGSHTYAGAYGHAEGQDTSAVQNGHAEGFGSNAIGGSAHAEGYQTTADDSSHAEGSRTSSSIYGHAEGYDTTANMNAHAEGMRTSAGRYCHSEGYLTTAAGEYAHTEGHSTYATDYSHTEGDGTSAVGIGGHVEGKQTYAASYYSHAEGELTTALGYASHTEGNKNYNNGSRSHVEGYRSTANISYTAGDLNSNFHSLHVEGFRNAHRGTDRLESIGTHIEGFRNNMNITGTTDEQITPEHHGSHIEGSENTIDITTNGASSDGLHVEGRGLTLTGTFTSSSVANSGVLASHIEGLNSTITLADSNTGLHIEGSTQTVTGDGFNNLHIEGVNQNVTGSGASVLHLEGSNTSLSGQGTSNLHIEGRAHNIESGGLGTAHIEGTGNKVAASAGGVGNIHLEGTNQVISGSGVSLLHMEGTGSSFSGSGSSLAHIEGGNHDIGSNGITSAGLHVEGLNNTVTVMGQCSATHVEGYNNALDSAGAPINYAHIEGTGQRQIHTTSVLDSVHQEGSNTTISNCSYAHTEGRGTIATKDCSHVQGSYNVEDTDKQYLFIIGNGTDNNNRSNAHTVDASGNAYYAGDVTFTKDNTATSLSDLADTTALNDSRILSLYPHENISAKPIVSLTDGADVPVRECVVTIAPVQAGSGTPSPGNPRAISGWTQIEVTQTGINLWDETWEVGNIDQSTGDNTASATNIRSQGYIRVLPSAKYCFVSPKNFYLFEYDANKAFISVSSKTANAVFTASATTCYIRFVLLSSYGATYNNDISINSPYTDTTYHAYSGQTHTLALGQTVYRGEYNVTTGELTITMGYIASYNGETIAEPWISSIDEYVQGATPTTGAEVAYTLATPTTVQLTPEEIKLLEGNNTIWADCGDTELDYRADTTLYNQTHRISYSTTEQVVGTWIDGKPLYQITLVQTGSVTLSDYSWATMTFSNAVPSDVKYCHTVATAYGSVFNDGRIRMQYAYGVIQAASMQSGGQTLSGMYLTIQYTKSTD